MTGILLTLWLLILLVGALYLVVARPDIVAAAWYRIRHGQEPWYPTDVAEEDARDPYPPEAADAPDGVDERFGSIYVESDHPRDCAAACCREIRLNELTDAFDWHAYEYEMRKTK